MIQAQATNEYERLIRDVCNIFRDVVGVELNPTREAGAIIPFAKEFSWGNFEFRLLIQWSWNDPTNREYLMKPGFTNLRTIFNPSRKDRLYDVIETLKHIEKVKAKLEEKKESKYPHDDGGMKERKFCCKCGEFIIERYLKVPDEQGSATHWEYINKDDYNAHYNKALWEGLKCVWPLDFKAKYYNENYLNKLRASQANHSIFFDVLKKLENKSTEILEAVDE